MNLRARSILILMSWRISAIWISYPDRPVLIITIKTAMTISRGLTFLISSNIPPSRLIPIPFQSKRANIPSMVICRSKVLLREVSFPVHIEGPVKGPHGQEVIGITGEMTINRKDFGISFDKTIENGVWRSHCKHRDQHRSYPRCAFLALKTIE